MHIPDGFLSPPVWAALDVMSLPAVGWVARRAKSAETETRAPLLGVLGAFVFAAQMINFPVAAGTSAHLVGGALLACTVGPAAAMVVMTAVLIVQALVFQDGGLLALGANVFNLAIAGVLAGYAPYVLLGARFRSLGIFLGGVLSVVVSGVLALGELALSGVPVGGTVAAVSFTLFAVSAVLEGAISVAVIGSIERMNPQWIRRPEESRKVLSVVAVAAVCLAGAGFILASAAPDTLERIAEHVGISGQATNLVQTPFADYELGGVSSATVAKAAAGLIGVTMVFAACAAAARLLRRSS
jgi:cobalt/nickel transport system permease protein